MTKDVLAMSTVAGTWHRVLMPALHDMCAYILQLPLSRAARFKIAHGLSTLPTVVLQLPGARDPLVSQQQHGG